MNPFFVIIKTLVYIDNMSNYPFQRLIVYPAYPGTTYITWDLHPNMQDPRPYTYQLQRCLSANPDEDWEDVGNPQTDAIALVDLLSDPNSIRSGYLLDCFYRVILTTSRGKYTSAPEGCFGQLHREEWKLANEILAKERLLFKKTAVPGVLLQAIRSGDRCPYCTDQYTDGITNSHCEHCFGTGYLGGYHKPFQFQAWQVSPSQKNEVHYSENVATINMSVDRYQARATGIPEIYNGDIWVDLSTAQRFKIRASKVIAQIRRVPLVRIIDMDLIPASEIAYKIPIGQDNYTSVTTREISGCGDMILDHDFPEKDALQYVDQNLRPISGAKIMVYKSGGELPEHVTTTDANGRWVTSYKADVSPNGIDYDIVFEKEGEYGPDYVLYTLTDESIPEDEVQDYNDKQEKLNTDYFKTFDV